MASFKQGNDGYKKPTVGTGTPGAHNNEEKEGGHSSAVNKEFDVEREDVGKSSTMWGGEGAASKAKAHLRAELRSDKNMTDDGPLGNVGYGGGHYTNKK